MPDAQTYTPSLDAQTQPGPGWWLASDGRWYPPAQQPSTPKSIVKRWWFWACLAAGVVMVISVIAVLTSADSPVPKGQTRFVAADKFSEIRACELLKAGGSGCANRATGATATECGTEPSVASVPEGTEFAILVVPTRAISPQEHLTASFTKDGSGYFERDLLGAEVYSKPMPCYIDTQFSVGVANQLDVHPLPAGDYHFEIRAGSEVLSAGELTITAN